jgi:hypothetical protein
MSLFIFSFDPPDFDAQSRRRTAGQEPAAAHRLIDVPVRRVETRLTDLAPGKTAILVGETDAVRGIFFDGQNRGRGGGVGREPAEPSPAL